MTATCELCSNDGGTLLWRDGLCRVVLVDDARFPGFCRLIWHSHVKEMSDLADSSQAYVFRLLMAVETAIIRTMHPDKINLASFGNMTPHLHWHLIPRWMDDSHFPQAVWAAAERASPNRTVDVAALQTEIRELCSRVKKMEDTQ